MSISRRNMGTMVVQLERSSRVLNLTSSTGHTGSATAGDGGGIGY